MNGRSRFIAELPEDSIQTEVHVRDEYSYSSGKSRVFISNSSKQIQFDFFNAFSLISERLALGVRASGSTTSSNKAGFPAFLASSNTSGNSAVFSIRAPNAP